MKSRRIAIAYCEDSEGNLLMGQRRDNSRFTLPAGSVESGEKPLDGMKREFKEETGYDVKSAKLIKVRKMDGLILYLYKVKYEGVQDTSKDPDKECPKWEYVDPNSVVDKLHVPLNRNLALMHYIGK